MSAAESQSRFLSHRHAAALMSDSVVPTVEDPLARLHSRDSALRLALHEAARHPRVLGAMFYDRLFTLAPQARALFPAEMGDQQQKFARTLLAIADALSPAASGALPQQLRQLGLRHRHYGAGPLDYVAVGQALGDALGAAAPGLFDAGVAAEWQRCYAWIVTQMLSGAHSAPLPPAAVREDPRP